MIFQIYKTSNREDKPFSKAKLKERIVTQTFIKDMASRDLRNRWYKEEGFFNQREENGILKRDYKDSTWFVEINSLEELAEIEKENQAELVLNFGDMTIEVYDDWRE